jgi:hypothetical protein
VAQVRAAALYALGTYMRVERDTPLGILRQQHLHRYRSLSIYLSCVCVCVCADVS